MDNCAEYAGVGIQLALLCLLNFYKMIYFFGFKHFANMSVTKSLVNFLNFLTPYIN